MSTRLRVHARRLSRDRRCDRTGRGSWAPGGVQCRAERDRDAFMDEVVQRRAENPGHGIGGRQRSTRDSYDNIMITIEREWGRRVTDDVGRALAQDAELWRDDGAAVIAGTDRIVFDLGGVARVGFSRVVSKTRDAFVMLEADRLTRPQVARLLSVMISVLSDAVETATATEVEGFVELVQLSVRFPLHMSDVERSLALAQRVLTDRGATAAARAALAELPAEVETSSTICLCTSRPG